PVLEGVLLADLEPDVDVAETPSSLPADIPAPDNTPPLVAPLNFPFAACNLLPEERPRRSGRQRTPSVRLQPLDRFPPPVTLTDPRSLRVSLPTPVDSTVATPAANVL
ncbi:unnamed protein product, partial [Pylaiella littoralis]